MKGVASRAPDGTATSRYRAADSRLRELQATQLACVRGSRRLFDRLDLRVRPGEWLHVQGENGAGKTSLLRLLATLSRPEAGEILWGGVPIRDDLATYRAELQYLGHLASLKDDLTPFENLSTQAAMAGQAADGPQVLDALDHWHLGRQARLPVRALSAGQRRRVALARLVLLPSALWILDEPFNALDGAAVARLGEDLRLHLDRGGLAVITSHQALPGIDAPVVSLRIDAARTP